MKRTNTQTYKTEIKPNFKKIRKTAGALTRDKTCNVVRIKQMETKNRHKRSVFVTNADSTVFSGVCLSDCWLSRTISKKTAAARSTKLETEIFHRESWKSIYYEVKRSKVKVARHKNSAGVSFCTLMFICL